MVKEFKVELEYDTPEFAEIIVSAENEDKAVESALEEFEKNFPEAYHAEVTRVKQL